MKPETEKLIADLKSENADVRYSAWVAAASADPEIVPELGKLLTTEAPGVRKAGDEALKKVVHSVGRETAGARRAAVVQGLIALTDAKRPKWVRTVALRHLSAIGGDETAPVAAKILLEPDLEEEAVFCIERIPGSAADQALLAALDKVREPFRPRIFAALGHRRVATAAPLCAAAMTSSNLDLAMAAMKALGRIGADPGRGLKLPRYEDLTPFQKTEFNDAVLRFADGMVERGATGIAIELYRTGLDKPEEHVQCAAIVGLAKTGSAQAAELIRPKLESQQRNVRITAQKALKALG